MVWEVRQHHSTHYHPFLDPTEGNFIELYDAPPPEDFDAAKNSYLEVIVTVTDDVGLKTTATRNIYPILREVLIDSIPQGMTILVDGNEVKTPQTFVTWVNQQLEVEAPDLDGADHDKRWLSWSNRGEQMQVVAIPQAEGDEVFSLVALYVSRPPPTPSVLKGGEPIRRADMATFFAMACPILVVVTIVIISLKG
jgi:hypothetical protein